MFRNFGNFRTFLSVQFQESISRGGFSPVVSCSCYDGIVLKKSFTAYAFLDISKVFIATPAKYLYEIIWDEL